MPGGGKWLLSLNRWRKTSSGNNSVYVAHMPNNTQSHVLLSTGDFYQEIHQRLHAAAAAQSHVCRLKEGGTKGRREEEERDEVRKHVTVTLRVHRPGLTLGKSPSGFLMTPEGRLSSFWVLEWRWDVRKSQREEVRLFQQSSYACKKNSHVVIMMLLQVTAAHPDVSKQHVSTSAPPLSLSHTLCHVETKNTDVCAHLKIGWTEWMWGRSWNLSKLWWLAWARSLEVRADFNMWALRTL